MKAHLIALLTLTVLAPLAQAPLASANEPELDAPFLKCKAPNVRAEVAQAGPDSFAATVEYGNIFTGKDGYTTWVEISAPSAGMDGGSVEIKSSTKPPFEVSYSYFGFPPGPGSSFKATLKYLHARKGLIETQATCQIN
jgi:hypothetical protein